MRHRCTLICVESSAHGYPEERTMPASPEPSGRPEPRHVVPTTPIGRQTGRLFNGTVATLTRHGISILGSRVLYVRGRKSGEWRSTPVNPLTYEGKRYLVSPRGHTQ